MSLPLGATETRDTTNRIYLNLRTGKLSETSKEEKPGFREFTTENVSGQKYHFFAKTYDDLTAYIKKISWHEFEFESKKIVGWNIELDCQDGKEWVLQLNSGDRPYQQIMQILPNVNFAQPVRIVAFMGKDQKTKKDQKVFLLTQNLDKTAKEWVKPAYRQRWLSTLLMDKIKQNQDAKKAGKPLIELTEMEMGNLDIGDDGKVNWEYPYIKQKRDGTWSFDAWTDFLIDKMNDEVIPAVDAAADARTDSELEFTGGDNSPFEDDADPFGETQPTPKSDSWGHVKSFDPDEKIPF